MEGWGETCTKRVSDGKKKGEGRGLGNEKYSFPDPFPSSSTLAPNLTWPVV